MNYTKLHVIYLYFLQVTLVPYKKKLLRVMCPILWQAKKSEMVAMTYNFENKISKKNKILP